MPRRPAPAGLVLDALRASGAKGRAPPVPRYAWGGSRSGRGRDAEAPPNPRCARLWLARAPNGPIMTTETQTLHRASKMIPRKGHSYINLMLLARFGELARGGEASRAARSTREPTRRTPIGGGPPWPPRPEEAAGRGRTAHAREPSRAPRVPLACQCGSPIGGSVQGDPPVSSRSLRSLPLGELTLAALAAARGAHGSEAPCC
jgi:hypothetical protein